jgi:putative ABC transport system permease protein
VAGVRYVAAASNTRGQIVAGNQNWNSQIQGTDVDLPLIRSWQTSVGAFFTSQDVAAAAKVAVLGSTVRDQLFGSATTRSARLFACRPAALAGTSRTSPSPSSA